MVVHSATRLITTAHSITAARRCGGRKWLPGVLTGPGGGGGRRDRRSCRRGSRFVRRTLLRPAQRRGDRFGQGLERERLAEKLARAVVGRPPVVRRAEVAAGQDDGRLW